MKKNLLTLILCLLTFSFVGTLHAQTEPRYQLRNSNFEAPFVSAPGTSATGTEPPYWHSFGSLTGSLASTARSGSQIAQSTDTRNGIGYSCQIKARTVLLTIIANGNMTTGRVNAGDISASNPANHNFTDPADNNFNEPWTSTPDSIRFWVKTTLNSATQYARVSAFIHDDFKFTDPLGGNANSADYIVAHAVHEWQRGTQTWQQITVPFDYASYSHLGKSPKYILITFTTNKIQGNGNANDALYIDDIEMVYSAWLTDLQINGVTIANFDKMVLDYPGVVLTGQPPYSFPYETTAISYTAESSHTRSVEVTNVQGKNGDADGGYTSILVTANDGSTKEYKIHYASNRSTDNTITALRYTLDGENPIVVSGVAPSILNYNAILSNPDETRIPQIREEDVTLSDPNATIYSISQPKSVNNSVAAITVRAEDYSLRTYTVSFSKPISSNSKLSEIKIDGINIPNFHSDTLEYKYDATACVTANSNFPTVIYEKASIYSNVVYTAATTTTKTATITIVSEDKTDTTTYTINFKLANNNANLLGYRVNSTNQNGVFSATNFVHTYSASLTAVPTLTVSTTSGQQVCAASTVVFPTPVVWYPDTNEIRVTAQDGITKGIYKVVLKNTNCYVATGSNNGFRYNYNGLTNQNTAINITTTNNNNTNTITTSVVTLPIGPNVPPELVVYGLVVPAAAAPPTVHIQQPATRNDTAVVTVTANDGVTKKIYKVPFKATLSTDASLSNITYNGFQVPGFNSATTFYTLIFPSNVTNVPEIKVTPTFQWLEEQNITIIPAATLSDTTVIVVTAENGTTTRTYRVAFEVIPQEKDAYLTDIRYDNVTIQGFNPTKFDYTIDIPYSAPTPPKVIPYASSPTALVFPSAQLNEPPYKQSFLVYSEDMSVHRIYTVHFNLVKNTNPHLADIQVNGISLQDFNSQTFEYTVELPFTELNAPVVTATPIYKYAQVNITQINTVNGTVTIHVTAEDEDFTDIYTLHFTRELSPITTLESIEYIYNEETYTYQFATNETDVTIMLPVETLGEPILTNIVVTDNRAGVEITEQPNKENDYSGTIMVTAEDLTEETYFITFERTLSESTLLKSISYNGISISNFDPAVLNYNIILPFENSQIPNVTAIADWQNTVVQIDPPRIPFGQATVSVTSENGQNTQNYTITFLQQGNPYLVTLSYNLDGVTIPVPAFDPSIFVYNVTLPIATTAIPKLEYVPEDNRCMVNAVEQNTANGTSQLTLTTWNQDASVTYTVNFTVALSIEATLRNLQVNGVTIANFDANTLNYTIEYEYGIADLPVVTAEATYLDAKVEIKQITKYPEIATVKVIAGDPDITRTYTISFSIEAGNNTSLSSILIGGDLLQEFNKNRYFYTTTLPFGVTILPEVTAFAEDSRSTVTVYQDGLSVGDTVTISVTALNGDVAQYKIFFVPPPSNNALLKNIFIDWEPLTNFDSYTEEYTYRLQENYTGTPHISVELDDPKASYEFIWSNSTPIIAQIMVTAESGENSITYSILFEKTSSIASYANTTEIKVYPNPTTGKLRITNYELRENSTIDIYNMVGKKVQSTPEFNAEVNLKSEIQIDISHLANGVYFLRIDGQTMKVVKN